ncbi:MAG: hypothetical protein F2876_02880 [Actinobacteria bacterium]|uniref:Unannotated protein n=1 Tax=freshwater metagenome TaxID=449393 RepID=A0A6J7N1X2_9ZZZZ|nr:hypothetical protein [Actinomycetota bacterium]
MHAIDRAETHDESRLFDDTKGFFRVSSQVDIESHLDALIAGRDPLDHAQANRLTRRFVDVLTEGRPVDEDLPDTIDYAERNNLILLFSRDHQQRFEFLYPRMPEDLVERWRKALRGGDPRDSFGPLTSAERLDVRRIEADLRAGRRQRRFFVASSFVMLVALVAAAVWWRGRNDDTVASTGAITFGEVAAVGDTGRDGPRPVVEKALVARLDRPVMVRAGSGEIADRIVLDAPATDLPQAAGGIAATLFRYNGAGQVVLVGPPGWLAKSCIQVSVMSASLRAFDTAYAESVPGACPRDRVFGRVATVGCTDAKQSTTMVDLVIPQGDVSLSEGGRASVAAVRIALIGDNAAYERNNLTTQISVAEGTNVKVPAFGGAVGVTVNFDVSAATGAPLVGSCTLR